MRTQVMMRVALAGLFAGALLQFAQSTREGTLTVSILDAATGQPTPVRVRLRDEKGERPRVRGAVARLRIGDPCAAAGDRGPVRHGRPGRGLRHTARRIVLRRRLV